MNGYIYSLANPETDEIRYIGITFQNLNTRLASHIYQIKKRNHKNACWIKSLLKKGLRPRIEIIDEVSKENWKEVEQYWIAQFKAWGFNLNNHAIGGEGNIGFKHSLETREKMKISRNSGNWVSWNKGTTNCFSQEALNKMSLSRMGRKVSEANRNKFIERAKQPKTNSHKQKLKEATLKQFNVQPIQFINIKTNEELIFNCKQDAATYFNVWANTITTAIKSKKPLWRETFKITILK